jgi:hypothetical protein
MASKHYGIMAYTPFDPSKHDPSMRYCNPRSL